jgi:hypothetical protein
MIYAYIIGYYTQSCDPQKTLPSQLLILRTICWIYILEWSNCINLALPSRNYNDDTIVQEWGAEMMKA